MPKHYVILLANTKITPEHHELSAAQLLAQYFKADVKFVARSNNKTPDFVIDGVKWELKSPTGKGKHNVQHQFKAAAKQASNMVFDARRSKIHMTKLRNEVARQFKYTKAVKRLVLISKNESIIELSK